MAPTSQPLPHERTFPYPILFLPGVVRVVFESPAMGYGDGGGTHRRLTARLTFKNWSRCGQLADSRWLGLSEDDVAKLDADHAF